MQKCERELNLFFERNGITPHIHYKQPFLNWLGSWITIASRDWIDDGRLSEIVWEKVRLAQSIDQFIELMAEKGLGVALCSRKDAFSKKKGRTIAKGRLAKILKQKNALH